MGSKQRGSPGTGARRRGETNLPHITWRELRKRYLEATTFEERMGLIHAARTAIVSDTPKADRYLEGLLAELAAVRFLTEVGSEVIGGSFIGSVEMDADLRRQARLALVRHCMPSYLNTPIKSGYGMDERILDLQRAVARVLVKFFAASELHCAGVEGKDLERVHDFLDARWTGCTQPDDEDQRAGGLRFSRDNAGLISRSFILQALVNAKHYRCLTRTWDAAPMLQAHLTRLIYQHYPHRLPLTIWWFPEAKSTRWIDEHLASNKDARVSFVGAVGMILQDCGYALGRIGTAKPVAQALLELIANLYAEMGLVAERPAA